MNRFVFETTAFKQIGFFAIWLALSAGRFVHAAETSAAVDAAEKDRQQWLRFSAALQTTTMPVVDATYRAFREGNPFTQVGVTAAFELLRPTPRWTCLWARRLAATRPSAPFEATWSPQNWGWSTSACLPWRIFYDRGSRPTSSSAAESAASRWKFGLPMSLW